MSSRVAYTTYFLCLSLFISSLMGQESFKQKTYNKIQQAIAWTATQALLCTTAYGVYTQGTHLYAALLKDSFANSARLSKAAPYLVTTLSIATTIPLAALLYYYLAKPTQQSISILISGHKFSPQVTRQCVNKAIIYASYIQILNTLRLEMLDLINNINVDNYQTFHNRPEILDSIFTQLTKSVLMSDFNKVFDMHSTCIMDISRELYVIIDKNKMAIHEIAQLQELITHIKKQDKESYDHILNYARMGEHLGLYHILHDVQTQFKIVSAGLQHGIDVLQPARLLHQSLNDFLDHWVHITQSMHEMLETNITECYRLQIMEDTLTHIRSLSA
ncbi:MAG: hypothetical protein WA432_02450 [Candidatus Babeliaceae bacterium]